MKTIEVKLLLCDNKKMMETWPHNIYNWSRNSNDYHNKIIETASHEMN